MQEGGLAGSSMSGIHLNTVAPLSEQVGPPQRDTNSKVHGARTPDIASLGRDTKKTSITIPAQSYCRPVRTILQNWNSL